MIRFIIVASVLILYLIITIPILVIEVIIGWFAPRVRDVSAQKMVQVMFRFFIWVTGSKVTVIGKERLPQNEAVLFVGNHRSYFDILVAYANVDRITGFVAKRGMLKAPILRTWMIFIHCLFLDRKDIKQGLKTILKGAEAIKNGVSIFIFPEGTRGEIEGQLNPFKEGSLKMAQKSHCKIVPVALSHTAAIWEDNFPKMKPAHVILEFGEPIDIEALDKETARRLGSYTQQKIQAMLDKNC